MIIHENVKLPACQTYVCIYVCRHVHKKHELLAVIILVVGICICSYLADIWKVVNVLRFKYMAKLPPHL